MSRSKARRSTSEAASAIGHYETVGGRRIDLSALTAPERTALVDLHTAFCRAPAWDAYSDAWQVRLARILGGVPRRARPRHPLYLVAQDLEMRLGIAQGEVAPPDYRDRIAEGIAERFGSRYAFCKRTRVPQAFVSQVLSGKKDFSMAMLRRIATALGLGIVLLPLAEVGTHGVAKLEVMIDSYHHEARRPKPRRRRGS